MPARLTLYVDPAWQRAGIHSPLLNPWWGNPNPEESLFAKEMFDAYQFDTALYTVTDDIAKADMVLPPYKQQWFLRHDAALWDEIVRVAQKADKPLLVDGVGDINYKLDIKNAYVLRIGGYTFLPEKNAVQVPPPCDDLLERCCGGALHVRKKIEGKPVVGFAGWAHLSLLQKVRTILKELPIRIRGIFDSRYRAMQKGVLWRTRALAVLKRSPLVALNLKERGSFSGSAKTAQADMRRLRQELVDTVLNSDYCLDVRGDANDSTRLFEICSLGRIPVLLNTERPLPFSGELNYSEFCLIVDFRDLKKLPKIIADFHKNISPEHFEAMQRKAREAFVNYFRIDAQMPHIVRELETFQRECCATI